MSATSRSTYQLLSENDQVETHDSRETHQVLLKVIYDTLSPKSFKVEELLNKLIQESISIFKKLIKTQLSIFNDQTLKELISSFKKNTLKQNAQKTSINSLHTFNALAPCIIIYLQISKNRYLSIKHGSQIIVMKKGLKGEGGGKSKDKTKFEPNKIKIKKIKFTKNVYIILFIGI